MCATSDQSNLEQEQMDAYTQAQTLAKQQYGEQSAIYNSMNNILSPILQAGPSQEGFSADEKTNLNSQAIEGTAENYKNAATAVGEGEAAKGGGLPMQGGPQQQIGEEIATSAAGNLSNQQSQIRQADYDQGQKDWLTAVNGEGSIAAGENPLGFETAATGAGTSADSEANTIAGEDNSWINATLGAVSSVGSGWATGGFKH